MRTIKDIFVVVCFLSCLFLVRAQLKQSECKKLTGDGDVCLSGGAGNHEGNVYFEGHPVCDDNWDQKDGHVVCNQLGFHRGAITVYTKTHFSEYMSGRFSMDEVQCNGDEDKLKKCLYSEREDCGPGEAAGVLCDNSSQEQIEEEAQLIRDCYAEDVGYSSRDKMVDEKSMGLATDCQKWCNETADCLYFSFDTLSKTCSRYSGDSKVPKVDTISGPRSCPTQGLEINCTSAVVDADCTKMGLGKCDICLKSDLYSIDQPIEKYNGNVFINNKPVCDDGWDMVDGDVLCKQLGYSGGARAVTSGSTYGKVLADFSINNVECSGSEQSIVDCNHTSTLNCHGGEAAGVMCDHRESGVIKAEKECFMKGLAYSEDNRISNEEVANFPDECQSLCKNVDGCSHFTWFMRGQKCMFFNRTGVDDGKLTQMEAVSGPATCSHVQTPDSNVGCLSSEICLVSPKKSNYEGNLMVRKQPVCDDGWDLPDAHVACKQLGFQRALEFTRGSKYGDVPSNFSMDNLNCLGNEETLDHCPHADTEDCDSSEGAGVICDQRNEKSIKEQAELMTEQCFVNDVVYGSLLENGIVYLPTVMDCQLHCSLDSQCSTFTYKNDTQECQKRKAIPDNTVSQCSSSFYTVWNDDWRRIDYYNRGDKSYHCDRDMTKGWYRLQGAAGTRLPTSPAPNGTPNSNSMYCGTHATAYMTGGQHPTPEEGIVSRGVCFEWSSDECWKSQSLKVAACYGDDDDVYYIYELSPPGNCQLAYCGLDGMGDSSGLAPSLCENGWIHFRGHCYYLSSSDETFNEAKQECKSLHAGANLVSIWSQQEQTFLEGHMVGSRWYYIGANRVNSEWIWLDGSNLTNYANWKSPGEPNNSGGSEYYAMMNRRADSLGKWFDIDGDIDRYYICKTRAKDVSFSGIGSGKKFRDPAENIISGPKTCKASPPAFDKVECSKPGAVCLDGGSTPNEGNIFLEGKPICDDQWNLLNAEIVCSQLKFGKAKNITKQSAFGQVNGPFAMTNVRCRGNEKTLKDCPFETSIKCIGAEAAGVRCETLEEQTLRIEKERELKECYITETCYDKGDTIGDSLRSDSVKSCQELCVDHLECTYFTYYTDTKKCFRRRGNRKERCSDAISGPRSCHRVNKAIRIPDDDKICNKEGQICLKGSNITGEGNVFIGGKPVCDDEWSITDGEVACKQLKYAAVKRVTVESHFGYVSGDFSLDDLSCDGTEANLTSCYSGSSGSSGENCAGDEGAGVVCDTRDIQVIADEKRRVKHCFMEDVFIEGTILTTELSVDSVMDCQKLCNESALCTYFRFNTETEECTLLKNEGKGSNKTVRTGMFSGPKECVFTEDNCSCNGASLCLCGGSGPHEGNLFMEVDGKAKPVCDDQWSLVNAHIVCKSLNFTQAANFTVRSHFGNVSMDFGMDSIGCRGREYNLTECDYSKEENCDGSEAAGVVCDTRNQTDIQAEESLIQQNCFADDAYYGESMEIYYELDREGGPRYPRSYSYVYLPSAVMCQKLCLSTENCDNFRYKPYDNKCYLRQGSYKYTSYDYMGGPKVCEDSDPVFSKPDCLNKGVACLSGGSGSHEGNVFIGGKPVCDNMWSLADAHVVCKQLGYCLAKDNTQSSRFGGVKGPFAFSEMECLGSEKNISSCRNTSPGKCIKSEAAGVVCEQFHETLEEGGCGGRPPPPRPTNCDNRNAVCLKGGDTDNEGNVFVSGSPVCDDDWDITDGDVVCKQLGFPGVERVTKESRYGSTSSTFSMDNVRCRGSETKITDCRYDSSDDCGGSEAAGVVCNPRIGPVLGTLCDEQGVICLKGGTNQNEGNVFVGDKPVCDDAWDMRDGGVVCRQLGFSGVENVTQGSFFGQVSSTFAMDDVACSGGETQLTDCRHETRDDCGRAEGAGVICLPASDAPVSPPPACGLLRMNDSISVVTSDNLFGPHNVLQDDCDNYDWYSKNKTNYWLAPSGHSGHFIADMGCMYVVEKLLIKNTHNANHNDRGTNAFKVSSSNTTRGPWVDLLDDVLPDVTNMGCSVELSEFLVTDKPKYLRTSQFIKFTVMTWHGNGGGLQYFNVEGHALEAEYSGGTSAGTKVFIFFIVVILLLGLGAGGFLFWKKNNTRIPALNIYNRSTSEAKGGILSQTSVDSGVM